MPGISSDESPDQMISSIPYAIQVNHRHLLVAPEYCAPLIYLEVYQCQQQAPHLAPSVHSSTCSRTTSLSASSWRGKRDLPWSLCIRRLNQGNGAADLMVDWRDSGSASSSRCQSSMLLPSLDGSRNRMYRINRLETCKACQQAIRMMWIDQFRCELMELMRLYECTQGSKGQPQESAVPLHQSVYKEMHRLLSLKFVGAHRLCNNSKS